MTYHSVSKAGSVFTDGTGLRHDPASFERQVEYLASCFNPISLRELVEALVAGEAVRRAVVVTFDDGFADTVRVALPILHRRRIPVTVFPVTSVIGNKDLMWQHKLAWLAANGHEERVCHAMTSAGLGQRAEGESAWVLARRCYCEELPAVLEDVLRSVGATGSRLAGALRPYLNAEDVAEADPAFVEFGNHTHTHAILSALSVERQRWEIETARDELVALTGYAPISLAYPFGLK
ncbi:MAG: polysaccharide deacetylase family protein, partial [bacterium]|nr:polysaccharide deacetylase family protein [bacterium]